jgi:hypothetical protein
MERIKCKENCRDQTGAMAGQRLANSVHEKHGGGADDSGRRAANDVKVRWITRKLSSKLLGGRDDSSDHLEREIQSILDKEQEEVSSFVHSLVVEAAASQSKRSDNFFTLIIVVKIRESECYAP